VYSQSPQLLLAILFCILLLRTGGASNSEWANEFVNDAEGAAYADWEDLYAKNSAVSKLLHQPFHCLGTSLCCEAAMGHVVQGVQLYAFEGAVTQLAAGAAWYVAFDSSTHQPAMQHAC
jgi:hypothetical protein